MANRSKKSLKEKLFSIKQVSSLRVKGEKPTPLINDETKRMVLIGPTNSAGQGYQWARALEKAVSGVRAVSMTSRAGAAPFDFKVDQSVHSGFMVHSKKWQRQQFETIANSYKGVLIESARSPFGGYLEGNLSKQLSLLKEQSVRLGLIFHGSDLRDPDRHMAAEKYSYFKVDNEFAERMRAQVRRSQSLIQKERLPVFVSTPDLLEEFEHANWLPVTVNVSRWRQENKPYKHGGKLRVAHVPSKSLIKGSDIIDPVLTELDRAGIIDYRRATNLTRKEMLSFYGEADVVVDQMRGGPYGVAAVEAMAAGRIVVSYVPASVRKKVQKLTGEHLPIVQTNAETLEETILGIVKAPSDALKTAALGVEFAIKHHDGTRSGKVLAGWINEAGI